MNQDQTAWREIARCQLDYNHDKIMKQWNDNYKYGSSMSDGDSSSFMPLINDYEPPTKKRKYK